MTCPVHRGTAVNPDQVAAQIESSVVFGLTAALKGEINIEGGAVKESNFHDYQMLRMDETPPIDVYIVDSNLPPTGVGEPGTPPIAPALGNALFAAIAARSEVAWSEEHILLSFMPVLLNIHSSVVSMILDKSLLVTIFSGTYDPVPMIETVLF